jgi:PAS domain S-box-containing protein
MILSSDGLITSYLVRWGGPDVKKLLVADNDEHILQSINRFFDKSGSFHLTMVHSVPELLETMITVLCDVVILGFDARLATETLKKIRIRGDTTPVIFFCTSAPAETMIDAVNSGASFYVLKGKDPESQFGELSTAVEEVIRQGNVIRALRESEARYRDLFENAPGMYLSVDAATGILADCNNATERQTGYTKEEIVGHHVISLYHPGSVAAARQAFEQFLTTGEVSNVELQVLKKDGNTLDVLLNATAIRDRQGRILYSRSVWSDITRYRQVQRALRESEERFRLLYETAPLGYQSLDAEGRVITVNQAWLDTLGYNSDEVIGHWFGEFLTPEGVSHLATCFPVFKEKGEVHNVEFEMIKKDGSHIMVSFDGKIGHDKDGSFRQTHCILSNITDQKRAEEALALAMKKLALMSSITRHDILNQLTLLDGYLSLAVKSRDDPVHFVQYIEKTRTAVQAIQHQIMFTRLYQELGVKTPAWVNVHDCIEHARSVLPAGKIKIRNLSDLIEVYADPLFEKIFGNLIDNAISYGGESMTAIQFSSVRKDKHLLIVCEDNGAGMTAEEKKHLFERGSGKHTGLGLFLSREIVSITGMTIEETSTPGHGARFEITVPPGGFRYTG